MSALEEIDKKQLDDMSPIEQCIWYTWKGTTSYEHEKAAEEYAALKAERDALKEVVQRLEFVETDEGDIECPSCRFIKPSHAADCELHAALKAGKK